MSQHVLGVIAHRNVSFCFTCQTVLYTLICDEYQSSTAAIRSNVLTLRGVAVSQ